MNKIKFLEKNIKTRLTKSHYKSIKKFPETLKAINFPLSIWFNYKAKKFIDFLKNDALKTKIIILKLLIYF